MSLKIVEHRGFTIEFYAWDPIWKINVYKNGDALTKRPIPVKDDEEAKMVVDQAIEEGLIAA